MKRKKNNIITLFLIVVMVAGLSLLLYPTFSDWWNSYHQTRAIASYAEDVANLSDADYEKIWQAAVDYNKALAKQDPDYDFEKEYEKMLDVSGTGIMGYVEIPKINCSLPIYHGTQESVLQIAVGHLEWSSLPVGGKNTHCVISGHRGLPSAKLFTNLDQLETGDTFMLRVLDEVLTYEVDQILIVEPEDTGSLEIEKGKDYCTLVTCTPYGVNSHRLLVRGHRVKNQDESIRVTADAIQLEPLMVAPIVAIPMVIILVIIFIMPRRRKR